MTIAGEDGLLLPSDSVSGQIERNKATNIDWTPCVARHARPGYSPEENGALPIAKSWVTEQTRPTHNPHKVSTKIGSTAFLHDPSSTASSEQAGLWLDSLLEQPLDSGAPQQPKKKQGHNGPCFARA